MISDDHLKQIQSRRRQHIHIGGVCIRCDQLHPCQVVLADALAAAQAEIAALRGALGGLVGFIDEKEMWFDAPTSVDALEARMATARALLAPEPQGGERRGGVSRDA